MIGKSALLAGIFVLMACADPKYAATNEPFNADKKTETLRAQWPLSQKKIWLDWEKRQTGEEFGTFLLKIGRANLGDESAIPEEVEGDVTVVLWMPSMGHGSSRVSVAKADIGTYRVSRVFFSMPGDWEIRVQRLVNGVVVEQTVYALRF